ncbi:unnamed protein product [Plutella xylostella]|uniref:(diamondback moth) hypothetical protein n=1 Tax=Plutella xylostella TaxID=51655 RepID=A0A8S4G149_PLUXY|nr:unnamed protein product [Plutella xylostella]
MAQPDSVRFCCSWKRVAGGCRAERARAAPSGPELGLSVPERRKCLAPAALLATDCLSLSSASTLSFVELSNRHVIEGRIPSFKSKRGIVSVNVVLEAIAALRTATEIGTCLAVSLAPAAAVSFALRPVFAVRGSGCHGDAWAPRPSPALPRPLDHFAY